MAAWCAAIPSCHFLRYFFAARDVFAHGRTDSAGVNALALWIAVVVWLAAWASLARTVRPAAGRVIFSLAAALVWWPLVMALLVQAHVMPLSETASAWTYMAVMMGLFLVASITMNLYSARVMSSAASRTVDKPKASARLMVTAAAIILALALARLFSSAYTSARTAGESVTCDDYDVVMSFLVGIPLPLVMAFFSAVALWFIYRHGEAPTRVMLTRGALLLAAVALSITAALIAFPAVGAGANVGTLTCPVL